MGSPSQTGIGVAPLLDALGRFCDAEGLTASDLHSIYFQDDEIKVVIVRADGSRRNNIYPVASLWLRPPARERPAGGGRSETAG
jgi:hypothetical protein